MTPDTDKPENCSDKLYRGLLILNRKQFKMKRIRCGDNGIKVDQQVY